MLDETFSVRFCKLPLKTGFAPELLVCFFFFGSIQSQEFRGSFGFIASDEGTPYLFYLRRLSKLCRVVIRMHDMYAFALCNLMRFP